MSAINKPKRAEQGATYFDFFRMSHTAYDENGEAIPGQALDLTGWKVRMQVRQNQQTLPLISATTVNGMIVLGRDPANQDSTPDPLNGWVWIEVPDETTDLLTARDAKYDIEAEDPEGRVYRIYQGTFTTDPNITQEDDDPVVIP